MARRPTYRVAGGGRSWDVVVAGGRTIPTITGRADGGLPAKRATEYVVESVNRVG
ncbi:MAG: hypothetical protein GY929_13140 [Actinomycetia bacterium]|nr:hypothetical protein [Actinomycetes bacterium]